MSGFEWNAKTVAELEARWARGESTATIGREMKCGKDAVVGKAHRIGLPARPSPIKARAEGTVPPVRPVLAGAPRDPHTKTGAMKGSTLAALGVLVPSAAAPVMAARTVIEAPPPRVAVVIPALLPRPCCWPLWGNEGRPTHRYCEAPGVPGKSYCAAHGEIAWVRQEARSAAQLAADDVRRVKHMALIRDRASRESLGW
jgi:GcrA cell cycle regulator